MSGRRIMLPLLIAFVWGGQARAAAVAQAAVPSIIVQLPPTTTAADLTKLADSLRSQGATIAPAAIAPAEEEPLARHVIRRLRDAVGNTESFRRLGTLWETATSDDAQGSIRRAWSVFVAVLVGSLLVESLIRGGLRYLPSLSSAAATPLFPAFWRHAVRVVAGLVGFLAVSRIGVGLVGSASPLVQETQAHLVDLAGNWRVVMAAIAILAAPNSREARPLALDTNGARRLSAWVSAYLFLAMGLFTGVWLLGRLGEDDLALLGAASLGIGLLIFKIAMFLRLRRPVELAILAASGPDPNWLRRAVARSWHWLLVALSLVIYLLALEEYAIGNNARAGVAATALQTAIVGIAMIWAAKRRFVVEYGRLTRARWWQPVVDRVIDIVLLLVGTLWLARVWGYDVLDPEAGSVAATVLRPVFKAVTTLSVAWLIWAAIGGFLGERIPEQVFPGDEDGAIVPQQQGTRLATLLPLIRNSLAIAVFFFGAMIALGDLGVDIGPLLAGAGIVGIALGFGAQALVRDVIAGLFFLIDDAFRLGEYIDTGRLKGTVEAISIRSVRLRHQNGQVHTIPFGQIQAVTNSSRDWAIVKFNLYIAPTSDLEVVRKTLKQLGISLLDDPEIGADFIQPLKMQGVMDVTQAAIMIRCKFASRPSRPSYLQRHALREIIQHFAAAGIAFATPPSNASNPH